MTKNDATIIVLLSLGSAAAGVGWAINIFGKGSERTYERMQKAGNSWPILRALKIERTPENCIRFLRVASAIGLFGAIPLVAVAILFALAK